jgi:putative ABC transport system substrate-binding protein
VRRRQFIAGLGSAAVWPLASEAQQASMPVVGYIHLDRRESHEPLLAAFRQGLRESGFIEDQNIRVEYRFGEDRGDRIPELATDLIRRNVAVIAATGGTRTAAIVKAGTSTIPIVFEVGADPVRNGLVASLNRPGRNVTGVNSLIADLWTKQLDLLAKLLPNSAAFAVLLTVSTPEQLEQLRQEASRAGDIIGRRLLVVTAFTPPGLDEVFSRLRLQGADALLVRAGPMPYTQREKFAELAARYAIPAIFPYRENAEAGGLISYGIRIDESFRLVGIYVGRILKGERPSDLPVVQPTKFELVINLKTAKALGLTIPETLLATADELIQ